METVYAWLVVNGFIDSDKFRQIFAWLRKAAKEQGCELEIKPNDKLLPQLVMGDPDCLRGQRIPQFALFWDKDIRLARLLEKLGIRLFNCADSIEMCDDKARTYLELLGSGIRMPRTVIAPKTFRLEGYPNLDFLQQVEQKLGYPMVVKECYGSFGQQVFLVHDDAELTECLRGIKNRPFLFQEYVAASKGRDIRIQMVGQRAAAAMYRFNPRDFRANITNGGSMKAYEPDEAQLCMARQVMEALRLDFAGVDILFGEGGEPVLCEVNSNAHFVNIFQCTGVNAAEEIVRYCLEACKNKR